MALKKLKTLPSGVSGEYWKITHLAIDRASKKVTCIFDLFVSKELSDAGAKPLGVQKKFVLDLTKEEIETDLIENCYIKVKAKAQTMVIPVGGSANSEKVQLDPELASAEDC